MASTAPILYFDLGSPYAYLALERARAVLGVGPRLQPVLLGALFARRGFGSWAATPAREQRVAEIEQRARRYGLAPLVWPAAWPPDGLKAMRCAIWAQQQDAVEELARAVFRSEFARGCDIADVEVLAACASECGLDAERMLRETETPEVKRRLRLVTDEAWDAGVRGVPSLRVGASIFYGEDQLELAAQALHAAAAAAAAAAAG